jgi:hypothetical protein
MKKHLSLIAGLMAIGSASTFAFDGKINIADQPGLGSGSGGAFKATIVSGLVGAKTGSIPGGPTLNANQFLTFCIERDEFLTLPGNGYDVNKSTSADRGGVNANNGDPISAATAWLFSNFTHGTLTSVQGFAYDNAGGDALQNAIWWLEQEITGDATGTSFEYLLKAATGGATEAAYLAARSVNNTDASVKVLNMFNGPGSDSAGYNQDLLVVVPEPSTYIAGGLALLPLLFGLRARLGRK